MFASEHRAEQIDIENTFKGIDRYVFEGRIAPFDANPNIVMQDIDPTPGYRDAVDGLLHRRFVRDVSDERHHSAARRRDHLRGLTCRLQIAIDATYRRPFARKQQGGGTALPIASPIPGFWPAPIMTAILFSSRMPGLP